VSFIKYTDMVIMTKEK